MKLLFENWRQYLKEEDEPDIVIEPHPENSSAWDLYKRLVDAGHYARKSEDPWSSEQGEEYLAYLQAQKVVDLFAYHPKQAISLGEGVNIDPDLLLAMKIALESFSWLRKSYSEVGPEPLRGWPQRVRKERQKVAGRFFSAFRWLVGYAHGRDGQMTSQETNLLETVRDLQFDHPPDTQTFPYNPDDDTTLQWAKDWLGER